MYKLTFTCKALTGDKVHTISIDDSSLSDTWDCIDVGAVEGNDYITLVRDKVGNTHDVNVSFDTNDDDLDELKLSLYEFDTETLDDEHIQTDHSDWTNCEILSVDSDEFTNEGEEYFYYI